MVSRLASLLFGRVGSDGIARTVVVRQIQTSTWPTILRTDATARQNVDKRALLLSYGQVGFAALTVLSSIITPLGLHETNKFADQSNVAFKYVPDLSGFGNNTMTRPRMPLSRDCHIETYFCPGAIAPGSEYHQASYNTSANPKHTATTQIPNNTTSMFTSATNGTSIASIFDIQFRTWENHTSAYFNKGQPYPRGIVQYLTSLLPTNDVELLEGIVADMRSGGIGFRNHSVPMGISHPSQWTEDILWLEPDISCVNTNLSFRIELGDDPLSKVKSLAMVDGGGFTNLHPIDPLESFPRANYSSPDVLSRAYLAARASNYLTAIRLNATDPDNFNSNVKSQIGRSFNLTGISGAKDIFSDMTASSDYMSGDWLGLTASEFHLNGTRLQMDSANGTKTLKPAQNYPRQYAAALLNSLGSLCSGMDFNGTSNWDTSMECGYFRGAPLRLDNLRSKMQTPGSQWRAPFYTCAAALKASIKTVTFSFTGNGSLDGIEVQKIADKQYGSNSEHPLWAYEDWHYPGYEGAIVGPLWGIVNDSYGGTKGFNFTKAPVFYLPFSNAGVSWGPGPTHDILAGASTADGILTRVLNNIFSADLDLDALFPRFSGTDNMVLKNKWEEMSQTATGSATIMKLVWTDIMTNIVVSTKTSADELTHDLLVLERRLAYDMRFGIPALVLLLCWLVVLLFGLATVVKTRHFLSDLRYLLNDTSAGRLAMRNADADTTQRLRDSSKEWLSAVGHVPLQLGPAHETQEMLTKA